MLPDWVVVARGATGELYVYGPFATRDAAIGWIMVTIPGHECEIKEVIKPE